MKAPLPAPQTPQNNSTPLPSQPASSGSGRMVTRVSSGAIRHKSVGELLGERDVTFLWMPKIYISSPKALLPAPSMPSEIPLPLNPLLADSKNRSPSRNHPTQHPTERAVQSSKNHQVQDPCLTKSTSTDCKLPPRYFPWNMSLVKWHTNRLGRAIGQVLSMRKKPSPYALGYQN
jgi:hypothetical protein